MQQSAERLAARLPETFREVVIEGCRPVPTAGNAASLGRVAMRAPEGMHGSAWLRADPVLSASFTRLRSAQAPALSPAAEAGATELRAAPLHRVLDVPLAVTLRFGQRQLTLRELLQLSTGSLVELDRQVEEPVDLMLGDRLIARGEVVIVDGNYGMRVTEVVEHAGGNLLAQGSAAAR